jgi:hypothetical protein
VIITDRTEDFVKNMKICWYHNFRTGEYVGTISDRTREYEEVIFDRNGEIVGATSERTIEWAQDLEVLGNM